MEAYSKSLRVMTAWYGREHVFFSEVLKEIGVTRFKNGEFMIAKQSFSYSPVFTQLMAMFVPPAESGLKCKGNVD